MNEEETVIQSRNKPPGKTSNESYGLPLPSRNPRIPGRWLFTGRVLWVIITLTVIVLNAASIPIIIVELKTVCPQVACEYQLNTGQVQQLQNLGSSLTFFAYYFTILVTFVSAFYILVGFILFLRQSESWIGLMGAFTLTLFGAVTLPDLTSAIGPIYPALRLPASILDYAGNILFPLFILVFPDGRLQPRWTLGLIAAWSILRFPFYFFPDSSLSMRTWPDPVQTPIWAGLIGSLIVVQYYRYRRIYGSELRQRTKWVVYGLMVSLIGYIAVLFTPFLTPPSPRAEVLWIFITNSALYLLMLIIPVSIAMAIMRYNLWDIDLIINRTLLYISLTAMLGGLYSASISLFQKIFIAVTGEKSDAALVISTLILASTFTPIKNGLQNAVDKRFKDPHDPLKEIKALEDQVRSVVEVLDAGLLTRRMLNTATTAFHAASGAVYLEHAGQKTLAQATPGWSEEHNKLSLPLEWNGRQLGWLSLGAREGGIEYSPQDRQALQAAVNRVAQAIARSVLDSIDDC